MDFCVDFSGKTNAFVACNGITLTLPLFSAALSLFVEPPEQPIGATDNEKALLCRSAEIYLCVGSVRLSVYLKDSTHSNNAVEHAHKSDGPITTRVYGYHWICIRVV